MKAMILAAGFGTRLRPITDKIPKALLPVAGIPQIRYVLDQLYGAGVREVIINLHHLADRVCETLGERYRDEIPIKYSFEPQILGTGGGLKKVEKFFDDDPFILINSDTLIEVDLQEAIRYHLTKKAIATMVIRAWNPREGFGGVEVDNDSRIRRVLKRGRGKNLKTVTFTGVHILSREIFPYISSRGYSNINTDCYGSMLEAGKLVYGFLTDGYWRDIGSPDSYFNANMDFLYGRMPTHCRPLVQTKFETTPDSLSAGAEIVEPVVIGEGCRLGKGCQIGPATILGENCRVGEGTILERVLALPGSSFADGEEVRELIRFGRRELSLTKES